MIIIWSRVDGISRACGWDKQVTWMGYGNRAQRLPMEQLVLSDKWARKFYLTFPVPTCGKDKKEIAARWLHINPWHHCNVQMRSPCHILAFSGFSWSFYLVVCKKKNPLFMWGLDRKICPSRSPFVITRQASWCQTVILRTDFSITPLHSRLTLIFFNPVGDSCIA